MKPGRTGAMSGALYDVPGAGCEQAPAAPLHLARMPRRKESSRQGRNVLVWFRRDLRTSDQTALHFASLDAQARGGAVIGVHVLCPQEIRDHDEAGVKIDLRLRTLRALTDDLAALGIPLVHAVVPRRAQIASELARIAEEGGCAALHFNREYEVNERARDEAVTERLAARGVAVRSYHDHYVIGPGDADDRPPGANGGGVRKPDGAAYTVFTPFQKRWVAMVAERGFEVLPRPRRQEAALPKCPRSETTIPQRIAGCESHVSAAAAAELWPAGEKAAHKRLSRFIEEHLAQYHEARDMPAIDGVSRLSPYLNCGAISPRQCLRSALDAGGGDLGALMSGKGGSSGAAKWIGELIWREFYAHVAYHFPRVCMHRAFKVATDRIAWRDDEGDFERWCAGETGFPIVDAGMRQLRETGWMHNRVRMITAMFLAKDLFIDWRRGEQFFMRHLIDGDLASNNGGWQWAAGTGTDAAPYFRIFNPTSQGRRFDPDGSYVRRYVPELRAVDASAIHAPYEARSPESRRAVNYPKPMVDRSRARERVIRAFKGVRQG